MGNKFIECPGCTYKTTEKLRFMAMYNFSCPRCGKHKLSEFVASPEYLDDVEDLEDFASE